MPKKITQEQFVSISSDVHKNKFIYSKSVFINKSTKVIIICPKHGEFLQVPFSHLRGIGCEECSGHKRLTIALFTKRARLIFGDKYDYSEVDYKNNETKVKIICVDHGAFWQIPSGHLRGKGCRACSDEAKCLFSQKEYILLAKDIHNDKYNYDKTKFPNILYANTKKKIVITCLLHGDFPQKAEAHLRGQGCPKCNKVISKKEDDWLSSFNLPSLLKHYTIRLGIKRWIHADGFDPLTNTVYEFYGDFWHGNPKIYDLTKENPAILGKTFGDLYNKTLQREAKLTELGYNIISIWESDYNNIINKVA
jgi:hypothetical protein